MDNKLVLIAMIALVAGCTFPAETQFRQQQEATCSRDYGRVYVGQPEDRMLDCAWPGHKPFLNTEWGSAAGHYKSWTVGGLDVTTLNGKVVLWREF